VSTAAQHAEPTPIIARLFLLSRCLDQSSIPVSAHRAEGPYASAEVLHESKYGKWASTRVYGGCLLPLNKHLELDLYYEHENNTGTPPNQQNNGGGLILSLYFPRNKK
jgi:hypothetical protein